MSELVRLDDVRDIPDMSITEADLNGSEPADDTWRPVNLADPAYAIPPEPPAILGLLYTGKRHVISGPPESVKTLFAYIFALTAIRDGHTVAIVDFEMGPVAARRLLDDLGATAHELARIYYVSPETGPEHGLQAIVEHGVQLAIIDAAIGAYDASGLDDNARKDVEAWARKWIRPLFQSEIATLVIDHVVKNAENRGKFTIGSERKLGGVDVHLGFEALKPLTRGGSGMVKVHVHKDRPGFLQRPHAAIVELSSDPATHAISWHLRPADTTDPDTGEFKPTIYMEKVSRELERHPGEQRSQKQVEDAVSGRATLVRKALEHLVEERFLTLEIGPRSAKLYTLLEPFRRPETDLVPTSSHLVPDEVVPPRPTSSPPDRGTSVDGDDVDDVTSSRELDVYDPAVQDLLDDGIPF